MLFIQVHPNYKYPIAAFEDYEKRPVDGLFESRFRGKTAKARIDYLLKELNLTGKYLMCSFLGDFIIMRAFSVGMAAYRNDVGINPPVPIGHITKISRSHNIITVDSGHRFYRIDKQMRYISGCARYFLLRDPI